MGAIAASDKGHTSPDQATVGVCGSHHIGVGGLLTIDEGAKVSD